MTQLIKLSVAFCVLLTLATGEPEVKSNFSSQIDYKHNEIEDDVQVIRLQEPYKTLVQTASRFAIAQTKIPSYINLETAMELINDAGYMLSKPWVLIKVVKAAAAGIASLLALTFLFPGAYHFLEATWRDPVNALNLDKYLSNGMSEKSVINILGTTTDEALSRVGLHNISCRERSLCYMGEILKCSFPSTAEAVTKFASEHFSGSAYKENKYSKAFLSGFVHQNCSKISMEGSESYSCLGNIINSVIKPHLSRSEKKNYQTIPIPRSK